MWQWFGYLWLIYTNITTLQINTKSNSYRLFAIDFKIFPKNVRQSFLFANCLSLNKTVLGWKNVSICTYLFYDQVVTSVSPNIGNRILCAILSYFVCCYRCWWAPTLPLLPWTPPRMYSWSSTHPGNSDSSSNLLSLIGIAG